MQYLKPETLQVHNCADPEHVTHTHSLIKELNFAKPLWHSDGDGFCFHGEHQAGPAAALV